MMEASDGARLERAFISPLNRRQQAAKVAAGWVAVAVVVGLSWEYAAREGWINPIFIGQPTKIGVRLYELLTTDILLDAGYTLIAVFVGFALASIAGMLAAFLLSESPIAERILRPYFTVLNGLPRIALAPLFLIWFGIGLQSKIALTISLTFFVVYYNTMAGIETLDANHIQLARVLGANRRQKFTKFVVPASIPGMFVGLELGFIYGMLGTIASEMIAGEHGLGVRLTGFAAIFDTNAYFAVLVLLALITTLVSALFRLARTHFLGWQSAHPQSRSPGRR